LSLGAVLGLFFLAWLAQPPGKYLLAAARAAVATVSLRSPWQGLVVLFLAWPFFLGASSRPGFFLLQLACWTWLACAAWALYRRGRLAWQTPPWPLLLLAGVWLICLPLAGREAWWRLWALTPPLALTQFLLPSPPYALYPLTRLVEMATWLAVFALAAPLLAAAKPASLRGLVRAMTLVGLVAGLTALLLYFDLVPRGGAYYNLSLEGRHVGRLSGFAFNRQYMATYILLVLPLVGCGWFMAGMGLAWRWLCAGVAALLLVCLALTGQKAPMLVLALQATALAWLAGRFSWGRRMLLLVLPPALLIALDWLLLNSQLLHRLLAFSPATNPYFEAWSLAWEMFKTSPLLGVGTGQWNPWTVWLQAAAGVRDWTLPFLQGSAHNQYMQLLAEQGLAGFSVFLFASGGVFWAGCRGMRQEANPFLLAALLALLGWLAFGLLQTMLYFRVFGLAFFLLLAFLAPWVSGRAFPKLGTRGRAIILAALVLLLGLRSYQVYRQPPRVDFTAGLYRCQELPGKGRGRWMGARAVMVMPAGQSSLHLRAMDASPIPGPKAQVLWARSPGAPAVSARLSPGQWSELRLRLPAASRGPSPVFLWVEHTTPPAEQGWLRHKPALGALVALAPPSGQGGAQCP
jgi:O-antigen ligase